MFFENEASQAIPDEEGPSYNNQNQMKTEIAAEILQCQELREEIVQKINQSKKALHEEEKCVLHQSKKIKEIDASIAASSKVLEQEMYKRWKFTRNLASVRNSCQDVNTCSEKTEGILNRCEQDIIVYEKQVMSLGSVLEKRKASIDGKVEAQRCKLQELRTGDEVRCESEKENLRKKITQLQQKTQIEAEALLELRSGLDRAQGRRAQITLANAENTELRNKLLEKQGCKQSLLASIEKSKQHYSIKINEMKSTLEDKQNNLQQITEENETIVKALKDESDRKDKVLPEISEYSKQLDYYKQKCSETEAEAKQEEEQFTQEHNKGANKVQDLSENLSISEHTLSEDKKIKSQLESELTAMFEEKEHGLANIERLKSEISNLQSLNDIKAKEVSEIKLSIDVKISNVVKISNDLIELTKKFNEKEMQKSQRLMKIASEIQELERQIQEVEDAEETKLNQIREEMESCRIKARDNLLKQQEKEKEIARHYVLRDQFKKEHEFVMDNAKQLENDLQTAILDHDILQKKVEETRRSNLTRRKDDKIFERPHTYRKREFDETSDSSMEGIISVQEHMKRQKLRASAIRSKQT